MTEQSDLVMAVDLTADISSSETRVREGLITEGFVEWNPDGQRDAIDAFVVTARHI